MIGKGMLDLIARRQMPDIRLNPEVLTHRPCQFEYRVWRIGSDVENAVVS